MKKKDINTNYILNYNHISYGRELNCDGGNKSDNALITTHNSDLPTANISEELKRGEGK